MEFLPSTFGNRPRLACELRSEGVVAARAEETTGLLGSISRTTLNHAALPLVRVGESAAQTGFGADRSEVVAALRKTLEAVAQRGRELTLIVPDAAVRVLLLDFDALPSRASEALPIVRFRLRKLVPFDVEDAAVSYQVMASARESLQVMAVAMPGDLLTQYESVVREAGFEPGAVLSSTLAALAGLREGERPALVVNACEDSVTTAIVRGGVLLLHRTVDLASGGAVAESAQPSTASVQTPPPDTSISAIAARLTAVGRLSAVTEPPPAAAPLKPDHRRGDIAQAVSVAGAYFEDTLDAPPAVLLSAGTLGAAELTGIVDSAQVRPVAVQEMVDRNMLAVGASTNGSALPLGWFAGVRGGAGELMRIAINLASRPFVELRPLFARLRMAMGALALVAIALGIGLHIMSKHVSAGEEQMHRLEAQTSTLESQRRADESRMRQPENQAVLERSRFLNDVFQAKTFSWTAVMMDLENVLPAGVQVNSIEPVITPDGDVNIRLRVSGDRDREVDLVRNLERSQRFVAPRLVNESAQSLEQGRTTAVSLAPGGVEFDILSGYNPLPAQKAAAQKEKSGVPAPASGNAAGKAAAAGPVHPAAPSPARPAVRQNPVSPMGGAR